MMDFFTPLLVVSLIYGVAAGLCIDKLAWKMVAYKCSKKQRELPERKEKNEHIARILLPIIHTLVCVCAALFFPASQAILFWIMMTIGLVASWVDIIMRIIPNELVLALLGVGVLYRIAAGGVSALIGSGEAALIVFAVFVATMFIVKKRRGTVGIGAGDFKLVLVAAIIVGFPNIAIFLMTLIVVILGYFAFMVMRAQFSFMVYFPMCSFLICAMTVGLFAEPIMQVIQLL